MASRMPMHTAMEDAASARFSNAIGQQRRRVVPDASALAEAVDQDVVRMDTRAPSTVTTSGACRCPASSSVAWMSDGQRQERVDEHRAQQLDLAGRREVAAGRAPRIRVDARITVVRPR
jgi:hypothetical protein